MSGFPSTSQNVQLNTDAPAQTAAAIFDGFESRLKAAQELKKVAGERAAMNERWVRDHPEDAEFLAKGGNVESFAKIDGMDARTDATTKRALATHYKTTYKAFQDAGGIVAGIRPNDPASGAQAKALAIGLFGDNEIMTDYISRLPDAMTPEQIEDLRRQTMSGQQQTVAEARNRGLDIQQQRADETGRHNVTNEGIARDRNQISIDNNIRTTTQSDTNNVRSTTTSSDNNVRSTDQSNTNNQRSTDTTRGSAAYTGRRSGRGGLPAPKSRADYEALPKGARYLDPNGTERTKP